MAAAMLLLCSCAHAVPVTKIGLNYIGGDSTTTKKLIDTGNLPVLRTGINEISGLIPYYRQRNPNGVVAVAMVGDNIDTTKDPVSEAQRRWNNYLSPRLSGLTPSQKAMVNYLEVSPNMREPHSVAEAQWWSTYAQTLCPLVGTAGFKPMIYTIGVGGIPTDTSILQAMIPSFRAAHQYGGGWAYHGYTIHYTKDVGVENWYSLRFRQTYSFFASYAPDLLDMKLVLAEGGVDYAGNPPTDGYAYRGSREQYADWLVWYDNQIKQNSYVVGVALFKIGGGPETWSSFDLDPMLPWMTSYYLTGQAAWPRPKTAIGACLLSEQSMTEPVRTLCHSPLPVIYADPSEARTGGVIDRFKTANPKGAVIAGMRSPLPIASEPGAEGAANKRWTAIWKVLGALSQSERTRIDYVDATPGPIDFADSSEADYFATYMRVIREKLTQNGFKAIIASFGPSTVPVDDAGWNKLSSLQPVWKDAGKAGSAVIFQTGVTSYVHDPSVNEDGLLKYRKMYAYLLKYKPWLIVTPVFLMVGDGGDMKTVPDAETLRSEAGLGQFRDWVRWFDAESNKDPDVLGTILFKFGAPYSYPAADLGNMAGWLADYTATLQQ